MYVDSYFYHNNLDISQSQHRRVSVSKGFSKKNFEFKTFQFGDLKTQQRYVLREELNISEKELLSLVDSLLDVPKTLDKACKCLQIRLPKPKIEIRSTK